MIYLICQDWANTSNNHAGIKYLCCELERRYPDDFKCIVIPQELRTKAKQHTWSKIVSVVNSKIKQYLYFHKLSASLISGAADNDIVFFMEYMDKSFDMKYVAYKMKKHRNKIKIAGLAHLVPSKLDVMFPKKHELYKWASPVDYLFTLGHSLTYYFISRGIPEEKLRTTFHYVDDYYLNSNPIEKHDELTVIAMGNQMRNITTLHSVVLASPESKFIICQGMNDMNDIFVDCKNVTLIPFVDESILKKYMQQSDISLNVMQDTIGSNVIVTSMAIGLAMICTDIGSIHDYCDNSNTIFCKKETEYTSAINILSKDREKLFRFRINAKEKARHFTIALFREDLLSKLN